MATQIFKKSDGTYLNVEYIKGKKDTTIVYLHGLLSSMQSAKCFYLKEFARQNGVGFLSFDFTSHGSSWGRPEDWRISRCLQDAKEVVTHYVNAPAIIVGNSMGGCVGLLLCEHYPDLVKAFIGLAPGADFMRFIWKNMISKEQKVLLKKGVVFGPDESTNGYCFSYEMFKDARRYYQLNKKIPYTGAVRIIQGDKDVLVPYPTAFKIKDALTSQNVQIILVKGAEHRLSTPEQLDILGHTLGEFINDDGKQSSGKK